MACTSRNARRMLGFGMLSATILLWVGSSVAVQTVFVSVEFHFVQPIFITLFNSAMSTTLLLPHVLGTCCKSAWGPAGSLAHKKDHVVAAPSSSCTSLWEVVQLSSTIGGLWLAAQCVFNWSLVYTSVATSTVLSSTSSVFTFVFSMLICRDAFKLFSFLAAVTSVVGCMLVVENSPRAVSAAAVTNSDFGNMLTLTAAAMFSLVSVMIRKLAPPGFDLSKFLGINGVISTCIAPILLYAAHQWGIESFQRPPPETLGVLALNALFGCTIANYLYTSAMLLLSPLVATVGMSLSIPVSAVVDQIVLQQHRFSTLWLFGAALTAGATVLAAFDLDEESQKPATKESDALVALFGAPWDEDSGTLLGRSFGDPSSHARYRAMSGLAPSHELRPLLGPESGEDADWREVDGGSEFREADQVDIDECEDDVEDGKDDKVDDEHLEAMRLQPMARSRKIRSSFSSARRFRPRVDG